MALSISSVALVSLGHRRTGASQEHSYGFYEFSIKTSLGSYDGLKTVDGTEKGRVKGLRVLSVLSSLYDLLTKYPDPPSRKDVLRGLPGLSEVKNINTPTLGFRARSHKRQTPQFITSVELAKERNCVQGSM